MSRPSRRGWQRRSRRCRARCDRRRRSARPSYRAVRHTHGDLPQAQDTGTGTGKSTPHDFPHLGHGAGQTQGDSPHRGKPTRMNTDLSHTADTSLLLARGSHAAASRTRLSRSISSSETAILKRTLVEATWYFPSAPSGRLRAADVAEVTVLHAVGHRLADHAARHQPGEAEERIESVHHVARADSERWRRPFAEPEQFDDLGRGQRGEDARLNRRNQFARSARGSLPASCRSAWSEADGRPLRSSRSPMPPSSPEAARPRCTASAVPTRRSLLGRFTFAKLAPLLVGQVELFGLPLHALGRDEVAD